jgi:hypothetical protein
MITRANYQKKVIKSIAKHMLIKIYETILVDGEGKTWRCSLSLDWLLGLFMAISDMTKGHHLKDLD